MSPSPAQPHHPGRGTKPEDVVRKSIESGAVQAELQFADIFDQINAYAAGTPTNVVNPDARVVKRP